MRYFAGCIIGLLSFAGWLYAQTDWSDVELQQLGSHLKTTYQQHGTRSSMTGFPSTGVVRVVTVLVDFPADEDSTTTGTGKMLMYPDSHEDHDQAWFARQLHQLASYYDAVSYGQLQLNAPEFLLEDNLFPRSGNPYTLPQPMAYYAEQAEDDPNPTRLVELFQDAIVALDADPAMDFNLAPERTAYLIVHAGSNVATDIMGDTPNDIPSAFISSGDLLHVLGTDHLLTDDGVPIFGGGIVAETNSQDNIIIDNLGNWAAIFARQLGLPDLYDTETGDTRVGMWDLLDFGQWNYKGFSPAFLSAWCRVQLGWVTPQVADVGEQTYTLRAAEQYPDVLKIPITDREYYLIENRQRDANGNGFFDAGEYDYSIPGSGLLIWHIDENVIAANLANNRVNVDPHRKGIDLEEADGIQDFDDFEGDYFAYGFYKDAFFAGNNDRFDHDSTPNSRSNGGATTGITIFNISEPGAEMSLTVNRGLWLNLPRELPPSEYAIFDGDRTLFFPVGADGLLDIAIMPSSLDPLETISTELHALMFAPLGVASSTHGELETVVFAAQNLSNQSVLCQISRGSVPQPDQLVFYTAASGWTISHQPLWYPGNHAESNAAVLFGETNGIETRLVSVSVPSHSAIEVYRTRRQIEQLAFDQNLLAILSSEADQSYLTVLDADHRIRWELPLLEEPIRKADVVMTPQYCFVGVNQHLYSITLEGQLVAAFRTHTADIQGLAVGYDARGNPILWVNESGQTLSKWTAHGTPYAGFPQVVMDSTEIMPHKTENMLIFDRDGDDEMDVVAAMNDGNLYGWQADGSRMAGFPLAIPQNTQSIELVDVDQDSNLEISINGASFIPQLLDGMLSGADKVMWSGYRGGWQRTGVVQPDQGAQTPAEALSIEALYTYPNPATQIGVTRIYYQLTTDATIHINIFDLAGDLIAELTDQGYAPMHQTPWDISNIATGVYICRLEAVSAQGSDVKFHKIAIIK